MGLVQTDQRVTQKEMAAEFKALHLVLVNTGGAFA